MNQLNMQRRGLDLGRSQSEAPGDKTLGGSRDISRPNRSHGRSLNKRKLKMKNKMKFTREDGTGMGSVPKIRTVEEKKYGSSSPNIREYDYLKEDLDALQSSEPRKDDLNKSESALSKLRHREHNPARQNF